MQGIRSSPLTFVVQIVGIFVILPALWACVKLLTIVQNFMKSSMRRARKNFQVANRIVKFVAVNMMNELRFFKPFFKVFFHDYTMLKKVFPTNTSFIIRSVYKFISIGICRISTFPFRMNFSFRKLARSNISGLTTSRTKRTGISLSFTLLFVVTNLLHKWLATIVTFKNKILHSWVKFIRSLGQFANDFSHIFILTKGASYVNN